MAVPRRFSAKIGAFSTKAEATQAAWVALVDIVGDTLKDSG
jgi:hypothetical protein